MRIAITGHRPDKLGGYDANNPLRVHLRSRFRDVLLSLVADALTFRGAEPQDVEVYVGGALGFDTDAARVCAETAVPFVVAVPFPSQWKRRKPSDQAVYRNMLTYAKRVEYVSKVDPPKSDGDFGTPGRVCQYGPGDIGMQGDKMYYINPQSNALNEKRHHDRVQFQIKR